MHDFNPSTGGRSKQDLFEFQNSQGVIVRLCLKKKKKTNKKQKTQQQQQNQQQKGQCWSMLVFCFLLVCSAWDWVRARACQVSVYHRLHPQPLDLTQWDADCPQHSLQRSGPHTQTSCQSLLIRVPSDHTNHSPYHSLILKKMHLFETNSLPCLLTCSKLLGNHARGSHFGISISTLVTLYPKHMFKCLLMFNL